MDNNQQFIQKRLLFKNQKLINIVLAEYFKKISNQSTIYSCQQIHKSIDQLQFQNFKYRMAILSAQKDQEGNSKSLEQIELNIQQTKNQIKNYSEALQKARVSKKNKMAFNDLAKVIQQYDKKEDRNMKIDGVTKEIQQSQIKYNEQKKIYQQKQRCLMTALSALKGFLAKQMEKDKDGQIIQ